MSAGDTYGELEAWQETVDEFGGRGPVRGGPSLLQQLKSSQLSGGGTLPTTALVAQPLQPSITLCEMRLDRSIPVEVEFSYDNLLASPGAFAVLDPGNGKVRITWGGPKGSQQVARVDGALGWAHGFTASYLRVEYLPVDELQQGVSDISFSQPRDLAFSAQIVPSAGRQSELQATAFLPTLVGVQSASAFIPAYAKDISYMSYPDPGSATVLIQLLAYLAQPIGQWETNGISFPPWQSFLKRPLPQRAVGVELFSRDAAAIITSPSFTFGLRL